MNSGLTAGLTSQPLKTVSRRRKSSKSLKQDVLNTQEAWDNGLGAITHIAGPEDQALKITATAPPINISATAGNSLILAASSATGGHTTVTSGAKGGSVVITAGNGAFSPTGGFPTTKGGDVTITAGDAPNAGGGGCNGGAITITTGSSPSSGSGGGALTLTTGTSSGNGTSGAISITTGDITTAQGGAGAITIRPGRNTTGVFSAISGGTLNLITGDGASVTLGASSGAGGPINVTLGSGGPITTATSTAGNGGALTITLGTGGVSSGNTAGTSGNGSAFSIIGGAGGAATGAGGTHIGGTGSALSFTAGTGGAATSASGTRTGGNGGSITFTTGTGGAGSTTNGSGGDFTFVTGASGAGGGTAGTTGIFSFKPGNTEVARISATASGGRLQVGSGSGASTGWIFSGDSTIGSGFPGIWPTSITPSSSNYIASSNGSQTYINCTDAIYLRVSNSDYFYVNSSVVRVTGAATIGWCPSTNVNATADVLLSRKGAANIQQGGADAASPIAQTYSVQSVATGTSNTAGVNFTINGSQSTGSAYGGAIIFQVTQNGAAATTQNTLVELLRISPTSGIAVAKTITLAGTTGAQTINKIAGRVNFAAGASSLTVTNTFASTNSVIICTVATNDATMKSVAVTQSSGQFIITANAAATAETAVNFLVIN